MQSEIVENPGNKRDINENEELKVRGPDKSRGRGCGHCKNHCKGRHRNGNPGKK
ncbi:15912_t:CDS:2 [Funneliformis caledonium]|uniref:15912_t:CDS:1 n=1 Tax=Funneliformis caledonium TaxID=1117310 RepID=A0A9N9HUV9_9GLOM|nr:15912_t:CDS:2 [Funneliformis caledonium]